MARFARSGELRKEEHLTLARFNPVQGPKKGHIPLTALAPNIWVNEEGSTDSELADPWPSNRRKTSASPAPLRALGCCAAGAIVLVLVGLGLVLYLDTNAKHIIETVGTGTLGVRTTVKHVSLGILQASSTVSRLVVANPSGFGHSNFLELVDGDFDLNFLSLFVSPFELQRLDLHGCRVWIDQKADLDSNAYRIVEHVRNVTRSYREYLPGCCHGNSTLLKKKIKVDRLSFVNVSAVVCIHPVCDAAGPAGLRIARVEMHGIGKKREGVYLHELLEMIVQALLAAALRAAPMKMGARLAHRLGAAMEGAESLLDYDSLHMDVGKGLVKLENWTDRQVARLEKGTAVGSVVADMLENTSEKMGDVMAGLLGQDDEDKDEGGGSTVASAMGNATASAGEALKTFASNASTAAGSLARVFSGIFSS